MKHNIPPRILLIGAGRFGLNHLRVLSSLEREGKLTLGGIVVRTDKSARMLKKTYPQYAGCVTTTIHTALLKSVDGVVIATPVETHEKLALQCLRHASVLLEKPIACTARGAERLVAFARTHNRFLMPGHTFRFHPATYALLRALRGQRIVGVRGSFVSPKHTDRGENAFLEQPHLFDVLDCVFKKEPIAVWAHGTTSYADVDLRYAPAFDAHITIGWQGDKKLRTLSFATASGTTHVVDYVASTLTSHTSKETVVEECPLLVEPLRTEHEAFLASLVKRKSQRLDGAVGTRIVRIAERVTKSLVQKPKVAVIGGGVFGVTAGLVFGDRYNVTIFERHNDLMIEATRVNQYRHHAGYHYPRSMETIDQIKATRDEFERYYKGVVVKKPSYYCVSNEGSWTTFDRFIEVCKEKDLPHDEEYPDPQMLDRSTVAGCILTNEYVYDYDRLKQVVYDRISRLQSVTLKLSHEIVRVSIASTGRKQVTVLNRITGKERTEEYDIVINATYANYNRLCEWLKVQPKVLEYRLKELAVVELPHAPQQAVTIMDGPYATIVPIGRTHLFTLGDVSTSVHKSMHTFNDKKFALWRKKVRSRYMEMIERCQKWFPILKDAQYVESMYVTLPIEQSAHLTDARKSSVVEHGFGCYSVLEGKICTSVSMARQLFGLYTDGLDQKKERKV